MKKPFMELLEDRIVLFDGAMGTVLIDKGMRPGECAEQWNIDAPETIEEIHRAYFGAGSDLVQTNTFGGNRIKLDGAGLGDRVGPINRCAAEVACAARPPLGYVAGDLGPTGKLMKPFGDLEPSALEEIFAEQAESLLSGGAEILHVETMYDLGELGAAVLGARRISNVPIIASMTFEKTPRGYFTMMGVSPAAFVEWAEEAGVDVIGTNCSLTIKDMVPLVREIKEHTSRPIMAKPNAGNPVLRDGRTEYMESPETFAAGFPELIDAGARIVGGCCGTTPAYLAAVASRITDATGRSSS